MALIIRHWEKKRGDWESVFVRVETLEEAQEYVEICIELPGHDVTAQDFEIAKEGSPVCYDISDALNGDPAFLEGRPVLDGPPMGSIIVTKTAETSDVYPTGWRYDVRVWHELVKGMGSYRILASFDDPEVAHELRQLLYRAQEVVPEVKTERPTIEELEKEGQA